MKKALFLVLIFLSFSSIKLYPAQPVVEVPPLLPEEQLELYEDSEGLFVLMVMDYYDIAVALRSQLNMLGQPPQTKFFPPSFEDLEDLDLEVIKKY